MKGLIELFKQTIQEWSEDKAPRLAAALAYYTVFSLAPLLVIVIAIAGLVLGREAVQNQIVQQIGGLIGTDNASAVQTMIAGASQRGSGIVATIIGVVTLLFGASGVFGQLTDSMNTMWEVQSKPVNGILGFIKSRFLSFTMVLGIGFMLLVSLVLSAALSALGAFMNGLFPGFETLMGILNFIISFGVIMLLFALLFKFVPDAKIAWKDVWLGAAVTALLFTIGKFAIQLYIGRSNFASTYGAAGSVIVILLWVYYSAQILFFGAEFTQVYANKYGSRVAPDKNAIPLTEEARVQQGIPRKEAVGAAAATGQSVEAAQAGGIASAGGSQAYPGAYPASAASPRKPMPRRPELLPQPQVNLLAISAVLATLVGFISGLVVKRGSK